MGEYVVNVSVDTDQLDNLGLASQRMGSEGREMGNGHLAMIIVPVTAASKPAAEIMDGPDGKDMRQSFVTNLVERNGWSKTPQSLFNHFRNIPHRLHNYLHVRLKHLAKNEQQFDIAKPIALGENKSSKTWQADLERQMHAWRENSYWVDHPPEIKEVISRKVLVDEDLRQVVEVEQAAIWRFLWWSGTISVHVLVDQNRKGHTVKFKQGKSGFMKRFEGTWKVEPLFVDEKLCSQKPNSWAEYETCSGGNGRVGSTVSLNQLIQPALVPPAPISWYLRGITTRTTEMLIQDLLAEALRLRGAATAAAPPAHLEAVSGEKGGLRTYDIKERWHSKRRKHKKK
ncbi:hypothetical protein AXF42_Ash018254 [Apostasia shenzhenica]|uniref:DUF220 domain-containing protein n=1 Tax=Apostasia shenzhenica TaxID=1088818 RepID=A0A2I0B2L1_9ASPA|nr:hypothetical protein AXF42_Ash018254 [Apostasia shenzhenica]